MEYAQPGEDARKTVCPESFAIPTQKPLDSFDSKTWSARKPIRLINGSFEITFVNFFFNRKHISIVKRFPNPIWKMRVFFTIKTNAAENIFVFSNRRNLLFMKHFPNHIWKMLVKHFPNPIWKLRVSFVTTKTNAAENLSVFANRKILLFVRRFSNMIWKAPYE